MFKGQIIRAIFWATSILIWCACAHEKAELVVVNGAVYTVNKGQPWCEAVAISDGVIQFTGSTADAQQWIGAKTEVIDADSRFVMPGFIEGHGHFAALGKSLVNLNFLHARDWEEIVQMVAKKTADAEPNEWIEGRGWHQEKWVNAPSIHVDGYPYHHDLSRLSPDNPVVLYHASGHSLYANARAMEEAGVGLETPDPKGGRIVRDPNGEAIGVFEERAMRMIRNAHQRYIDSLSETEVEARWYRAISLAQEECIRKGVTSFQDAGSTFKELERYEQLALNGDLDIRLWAMVRHSAEEMRGRLRDYRKVNVGDNRYTCRAIKSEVDGALGAHGAWLLSAYADKADFTGQNTTDIEEVERIADLAVSNDMQLCVHAIGDRANYEVLNLFDAALSNGKNPDHRWRVEHAQHLQPSDIPRFAELGAIASIQGIHCTSDAPFVVKRLGHERARSGAYAWRSLLDAGVRIANGTDAPVEDVDPLQSFYASVTRKRVDSDLVFFAEQRMTRAEAIHSYTLGNAYAAFEENLKGSIEVGKVGDLVILSHNLMHCEDEEILDAKIVYTIIGGGVKYVR